MRERGLPLYTHTIHPHKAKNINDHLANEQAKAGFNTRLAVVLTKGVGTMWCAYIFTALAVIGLFGLLGWLNPFTFLLATWVSQQFLQLVFLPILSVGQNVLGRHSELLADEMYNTTLKSYHDIGQVIEHLTSQDAELLRHMIELQAQTKILINLQRKALGDY